jgi:hypothetical protein
VSANDLAAASKLHVVQRKLLAPDGTQIFLAQLRQAMSASTPFLHNFVDMRRSLPPEIDAAAWKVKTRLHAMIEKVMTDAMELADAAEHRPDFQPSLYKHHEGLCWQNVSSFSGLSISLLPQLHQPLICILSYSLDMHRACF